MPKPPPDAIHAFKSQKAFAAWLGKYHDKRDEIFVRIYKKGSGVPSVTVAEALDVALSWGWIDAIRHGYDEVSFLQRYTPRRAKSIWSQINREHVQRLIDTKQMTPHGLLQVEAAKRDGRWDAAYASAKSMVVPDDLRAAIERDPKARKTFATLNKQNLYALGFRMSQLRTAAGRAKKIEALVSMLARGETPHAQPER
jgi:uncharacterized protein YdeI (YjbR/CyaY-like superfamily)